MLGSRRLNWLATGVIATLLFALIVLLFWPRSAHGQIGWQGQGVARGERIVQQQCARCHATGRADASPNPKAPPFREVGKNHPLDHLAEALAEGIVTGDNDMPEFRFGPQDIGAILDYIASVSAHGR